jgi:cell division protein FtsL
VGNGRVVGLRKIRKACYVMKIEKYLLLLLAVAVLLMIGSLFYR